MKYDINKFIASLSCHFGLLVFFELFFCYPFFIDSILFPLSFSSYIIHYFINIIVEQSAKNPFRIFEMESSNFSNPEQQIPDDQRQQPTSTPLSNNKKTNLNNAKLNQLPERRIAPMCIFRSSLSQPPLQTSDSELQHSEQHKILINQISAPSYFNSIKHTVN